MRRTCRLPAAGSLALCLLSALVLRSPAPRRAPASGAAANVWPTAPQPRTPAQHALWHARHYRTQAKLAVNREREMLEFWDPAAAAARDPERWRLQLLAADPDSDMSRAAACARQAAALARTPAEAYQAAELRLLIAHETGRREDERQQARRVLDLAPEDPAARRVLARRPNQDHASRGAPPSLGGKGGLR